MLALNKDLADKNICRFLRFLILVVLIFMHLFFLPHVWTKMHESDVGNEFVISNPFIATICLVNPQLEGRMGSRDN